jgi:hypothetical protein
VSESYGFGPRPAAADRAAASQLPPGVGQG